MKSLMRGDVLVDLRNALRGSALGTAGSAIPVSAAAKRQIKSLIPERPGASNGLG